MRRTHRRADALDADRGENFVEAPRELGVSVADEEPEAPAGIVHVRGEVPRYLGHPGTVRVGSGPENMHDAALDLDDEQDVVAMK